MKDERKDDIFLEDVYSFPHQYRVFMHPNNQLFKFSNMREARVWFNTLKFKLLKFNHRQTRYEYFSESDEPSVKILDDVMIHFNSGDDVRVVFRLEFHKNSFLHNQRRPFMLHLLDTKHVILWQSPRPFRLVARVVSEERIKKQKKRASRRTANKRTSKKQVKTQQVVIVQDTDTDSPMPAPNIQPKHQVQNEIVFVDVEMLEPEQPPE